MAVDVSKALFGAGQENEGAYYTTAIALADSKDGMVLVRFADPWDDDIDDAVVVDLESLDSLDPFEDENEDDGETVYIDSTEFGDDDDYNIPYDPEAWKQGIPGGDL